MKKTKGIILGLTLSMLSLGVIGCGPTNPSSSSTPSSETSSSSSSENIDITVDTTKLNYTIDIYASMYLTINLNDTIVEKNVAGLTFEATSDDTSGITLSAIQDNGNVNVFSTGVTGTFTISVKAMVAGELKQSYKITILIEDNSPVPVKIKDIENQELSSPKLIDGSTNYDLTLDLAEYIDASDYVSYQMECDDPTASMTVDGKIAKFNFKSFGVKEIILKTLTNEVVNLEMPFTVTLTPEISNQLYNGGFEDGFAGWDADENDKLGYSIYDSEVDIWGNYVGNDGKYLYGYTDETLNAEFSSSLFKAAGSGLITFKLAGNCTDDLQVKLMKYNENGAHTEIAKFNNWYYGKYAGSGFIFRDYQYTIPTEHIGSDLFFTVIDNKASDFGFICLDKIITHYTTAPSNIEDYYPAGFKKDPSGGQLDMSDTSMNPFTPLANVSYQLPNGDFESGYDNWFMTTADKNAYAIYGSNTDIWGNPVNNTKSYLYGYANEAYTPTFHSDLFKVGGTGLITFKLAGYHTQDLQFRLVKYIEDGDDVVIERFNNWFCNPDVRNHSGFIMQNYYYQIDLATYEGAYCYFEVYDAKKSNFGFICLDDIITYYQTNPTNMTEENNFYPAGYVTDPRA